MICTDLLAGDFETCLSYFRTELPRLFVKEEQALQLILLASKTKVGTEMVCHLLPSSSLSLGLSA